MCVCVCARARMCVCVCVCVCVHALTRSSIEMGKEIRLCEFVMINRNLDKFDQGTFVSTVMAYHHLIVLEGNDLIA